jgi:Asp-tRNA(Asn)/Glu-tRNA(Gln) amidotransferase A subunit family amidase
VTASEAARRIRQGTLGAREWLREHLQVIAEKEPAIQAWEHLDEAGALEQARQCDQGLPRGILHGIPIGVKDIIDVQGLPCKMGTPIYRDRMAGADAACVALARAAGAVVLGKTVTTELAWFQPGKTRNPHYLDHTPGGSSSGSAAAVAAGMVPLAFGTQTAGSVLRPAAYCGVAGFKPSFGLVPRAGVKSQSESLDTIGWFARSVDDLALMAEALTWNEAFRPQPAASATRIGILELTEHGQASPAMLAAIDEAARTLAAQGFVVSSVSRPAVFDSLNAAQETLQLFEAARSYFSEYSQHREQLSEKIRGLLERGRGLSWSQYMAAREQVATCRSALPAMFSTCDIVLLPAAPDEAPAGLGATGDPVFNRAATALGIPALSLPFGKGARGLPLGVQCWAHEDSRLLHHARKVEAALSNNV